MLNTRAIFWLYKAESERPKTGLLYSEEGKDGAYILTFLKKHYFLNNADLPFEGVPKSRFVLISSITQQVFIHHVCFLLNLQSHVIDLIPPIGFNRQ